MYDRKLVITGLAIFVILMTFPLWYNGGNAGDLPKVEKPIDPIDAKQCVKDLPYMRTSHMVLLDQWRNESQREGKRENVMAGDQEVEKSLMNGCMKCHTEKAKFCDQCHLYLAVKPYCWDCHFPPKETL